MSNRQSILIALNKQGPSTYDDLEHYTGIARDKLRIAINDAKKAGHVTVGRDDVTNQPSYAITAAGQVWLKANMGTDLPEPPVAKATRERTLEPNTEKPDPLETELAQVRQQLALAEQNRDDLKKQAEQLQADLNYANSLVSASSSKIETLQALVESAGNDVKDIKDVATGYLIKVPNRKPVNRTHPEGARQAAIMAAHIHGRADVIALVPVGTARGKKTVAVEWQEA